jgi:hypothetical protein
VGRIERLALARRLGRARDPRRRVRVGRAAGPYLLAAFVVGIAYALLVSPVLSVPWRVADGAQGVIGVTAGSYLQRSSIEALGAHLVPIEACEVRKVGSCGFPSGRGWD